MIVLQPTASLCWSSRMLVDLTSSTVRGRSLKSDSTTREATCGSATTCSVNWHIQAVTSSSLTCNRVTIPTGITPSTVHSLFWVRRATTRYMWLGTRVTPVWIHSVTITVWCSARMTATMTFTPGSVQWVAADSGTGAAFNAASTVLTAT